MLVRNKTLNQYLMEQCCGFRCGVVLPFQRLPANFCDISNAYNYSVPADSNGTWQTASGSMNFNENNAIMGAVGEALERYSAAACDFETWPYSKLPEDKIVGYDEFSLFSDEQYESPGFFWAKPSKADQRFGKVYSLYDNEERYAPQELIGLGSRSEGPCIPSTSTGVAAHTTETEAAFSALLELLERDALATWWLHSIGGREIPLEAKYTDEVKAKSGQVFCFDITQDWNPFPVAVVCGHLPSRGKLRISMGSACRESYGKAVEKAYAEWLQGCIFAEYYDEHHSNLKLDSPSDATSFDLHAVYYTKHPEQWGDVPLLKNRKPCGFNGEKSNLAKESTPEKLAFLLKALKKESIRVFYKDLTTVDVRSVGVSVIRVMSPELSPIHGDENMPFLGGRTKDAKWRYNGLECGVFPNPYPHPLG